MGRPPGPCYITYPMHRDSPLLVRPSKYKKFFLVIAPPRYTVGTIIFSFLVMSSSPNFSKVTKVEIRTSKWVLDIPECILTHTRHPGIAPPRYTVGTIFFFFLVMSSSPNFFGDELITKFFESYQSWNKDFQVSAWHPRVYINTYPSPRDSPT